MNHFLKFIQSHHLLRHFSSLPKLPYFTKIPSKYRSRAIKDAQQALTDYLHCTRYIPFVYAEHIAKNSLYSLSSLVSGIDFSAVSFNKNVLRLLRYHPINEYEFFFESIGIDYDEVSGLLPSNKFFFSEDETVLDAACALSGFGLPWNRLGKLYKEDALIFRVSSKELKARLCRIKEFGFSNNISVIGICLAFPCVLRGVGELECEVAALLNDLKRVFVDFDLGNHVEANVDSWYEICRKMRMFYDLGCEKGKIGELMGRNKSLFLRHSEEVMVRKIEYFCRFLVRKEDVGLLILRSPEILDFDLETPVISVMGILKHFGLNADERNFIAKEYPYVLGRNKMANLPNVMKALNLHEWLFNKIKDGNHLLLANCAVSDLDEDFDMDFRDSFERIQFSRTPIHTTEKLIFLHRIGFGENSLTMKVLAHVHGTSAELQERFDSLLGMGITFSKLCKMVQTTPKVLNQSPETIARKLNFLRYEMGVPLDYLDIFPAFLCFNLEKRIKPRYRFHKWLTENGLCTRNYSIASIVATGEKSFVARLSRIHPDAPKHWLESFSYQEPGDGS
ncbi:RNA-binding KH domain-containing protein isoform 1 [Hibiscus syriacus]|uniref:RNA-binding KH domain-containing protein isoform 1 n=1 Tax=Hibiscus syriacus TaxID=106335 RepID=A0A6A2ZXV7_HIBSY|nr:transcription termination factor MTEF18, mitochondrial-like [Hibiscus syriacus]KAE8696834.1 RNA-binding KH domain-containing protein isoform 1 [Hibiscus syriacus]